jgi:hypothetical protein
MASAQCSVQSGASELYELYEGVESETNPAKLERFLSNKAIIDYIDNNDSENII